MKRDRVVAVLTIHGAGEMTENGRNYVSDWLYRQAQALEHDGGKHSRRFRARRVVAEKEKRRG